MNNIIPNWKNLPKKKVYFIAAISIVFLIAINFLYYNYLNNLGKLETSQIEIAGRQSMVSQKITKLAYQCQTNFGRINQLKTLTELWNKVHIALQKGNPTLGLPKIENNKIKHHFQNISWSQENIYHSIMAIQTRKDLEYTLEIIGENEKEFLTGMEEIIDLFDETHKQKSVGRAYLQIGLIIISLILLLVEFIFILNPILQELKIQKQLVNEKKEQLDEFAFITSHKLRAPLSNILGIANHLKTDIDKLQPGQSDSLSKMVKAAGDLDHVIHQMNNSIAETNSSFESKGQAKDKEIKRVMLVDDDKFVNLINKQLISTNLPTLEIKDFSNPIDALKEITEYKPEMVLLDLQMPEMTGFEFLDELQSRGVDANVVILSSSIDPADQIKAFKHKRVKGFYSKPLYEDYLNEIFDKKVA